MQDRVWPPPQLPWGTRWPGTALPGMPVALRWLHAVTGCPGPTRGGAQCQVNAGVNE